MLDTLHARHATRASAHDRPLPKLLSRTNSWFNDTWFRENNSIPFDWYYLNPFAPCAPLCVSQYWPTFGQQCLENVKNKYCLSQTFFKECSTSFLMVGKLIDFALLVLKLLMFKVCVIICNSRMKFSDFSGTERVNICLFVFEENICPLASSNQWLFPKLLCREKRWI